MAKKVTIFLVLITLSMLLVTFLSTPAFAGYMQIPKFLCEKGIKYYEMGDYSNALNMFKKVLVISPEGKEAEIARKYIRIIREIEEEVAEVKREMIPERELAIQQALEEALERPKIEVAPEAIEKIPEVIFPPAIVPAEEVIAKKEVLEEIPLEEVLKEKLVLDEELRATQPSTKLELEVNQAFIIEGREIGRWLSTSPEVINVERIDIDQIKVIGKRLGQTYLHIWDQSGRWTLNIKVIPPRYIKRLIEIYRERIEEAEPFKFRYSFIRNSFHEGRKLSSTERQSLTFDQWFGLTGETPYGFFDTMAQISKLSETTDLTQGTIGLTDGSIGGLEDFDIRGFDYTANFSDLCFPGESLRGLRFDKRAFDNRLSYTTIWGREEQGKFGRLSPGLAEVKDAFITGGQLDYSPSESLHYRLSSAWGYGDDREEYLKDNVVDLAVDYRIKEGLNLGGEMAYDSDHIALILHSKIVAPKLRLAGEFRDLEKDFLTITGRPSRAGELGGKIEVDYSPFTWLDLSGDIDLYRDRLFPNPDNPRRLNIDLDTSSHISINPTTYMRLNYQYKDEKGKFFPRQANSFGLWINKRFPDLRNLFTYFSYRYRDSENPDSPTSDYTSNTLTAGLSLRLLDNLSYYASKEMSWLTEEYTDEKSRPSVFTTGLDYYSQLLSLPLYLTLRFNYRNEEEAASPYSFLAGEDSVGFFSEISYRPTPDFELFASSRLKNIWADNPDAEGGAEMEIRIGGRLLWDTGFHWNPVGTIIGLVYKDLNDDKKKQDNEPGVKGIKLSVGKETTVTDEDGSCIFPRVSGKQATINVVASSLPQGFVVSGPDLHKIKIEHNKTVRVDFGIISRSEIYGIVFEDVDEDGKFGLNDIGIAKVELSLEDDKIAITDSKGQYYFRRLATGDHTITLDLDSLPLDYLPTIPITKKITLFEGISYIHHIPLKRAK